ncbi:MAG: C13 family peptidase [Burkholderiales bacterium]
MTLLVAGVALLASWAVESAPCLKPDALTVDGGRYCGPLVEGKLHGRGVLEWDSGERYEGEFAHGRYSGMGRLRMASGEVYEGQFRDGQMEGRGRTTLLDGSAYVGEYRANYFNGTGRLEYSDGRIYEGSFGNGYYDGQGRYSDTDSTYVGRFKDGLYSGQGEVTYTSGAKYRGAFERGRYQGTGRYESAAGDVYEGEFSEGTLNGHGLVVRKDGSRYEGMVRKWRYHGAGTFKDAEGNAYEGEFSDGVLSGRGRLVGKDGSLYEGEFKDWLPHGQGRRRLANGDLYEGTFAYGSYDGAGTLTYAKPKPDGTAVETGTWRYGVLENPGKRARQQANVETALYAQRRLLDRALAALAPRDPQRINLYLLAVAGDGTQEVFRREVEYVRDQFAQRFDAKGRTVLLINSRNTVESAPMATQFSIRAALEAIAAGMDRSKDILFLFLTSHGSKEHELTLSLAGVDLPGLPAGRLAELLRESGIRWKVVIVSACYGGGFADALADENTLLIAAARRDRRSFGCADENDFTYFGRAYFKEALPRSRSFHEAFRKASALVREWELKEAKAPAAQAASATSTEEQLSLPQIHSADPIEKQLQRWWAQFPR